MKEPEQTMTQEHQKNARPLGSGVVPCYTFTLKDFIDGNVRINFTTFTGEELRHLREICKAINPYRNTPAYSFGVCYYCEGGRWHEGGRHQLTGLLCRATEISV